MLKCTLIATFIGLLLPATYAQAPAALHDLAKLRDAATLDAKISRDAVTPSLACKGKKMRSVTLNFHSITWQGEEWRHDAVIYFPEPMPEKNAGLAAIVHTSSLNLDLGFSVKRDYGEAVAVDLGIPVVVIDNLPGYRQKQPNERELLNLSIRKCVETQDLTWFLAHPMAEVYVRAITLLESIQKRPVEKVIAAGMADRAVALWHLAAIEPKVKGILSASFDTGTVETFFAAAGVTQKPSDKFLACYEPLRIARPDLATQIVVGTSDAAYPSLAVNSFYEKLPGDKNLSFAENAKHGYGTARHLACFRTFIDHVFFGRTYPKMTGTVAADERRAKYKFSIETQTKVLSCSVVYAHKVEPPPPADWPASPKARQDFEKAKHALRWKPWPMNLTPDGQSYRAEVDFSETGKLYYYYEVEDTCHGLTGYTASPIRQITKP